MKKSLIFFLLSALLALGVYADEPIEEPVEEVITSVNSQAYAIDAYQLLEHSLQFAYGGYPDHYAGCWLEGDALCVGVTTEDEGIRSVYLDILAPAKCRIEYRVVKYSYNQLMRFNEVIWSGHAVDPLAEPISLADTCGLNSSGIVTDRNCVEITSEQGYSDELYAALLYFAEAMGADGDIFDLEESAVTILPAMEEAVVEEVAVIEEGIIEVSADESLSVDCAGPPENYAPVSVFAHPMDEYAHENNGYPAYYAGHRYPFGDLIVYVTKDADENDRKEIRAIYGDDVSIENQKYSLNQLADAYESALEYTENSVWGGIDLEKNCVVLHTFEPYDKIAELLRRTAGRIGAENDIFELNESTYPDTTADLFVIESGSASEAAAVLLDEWESGLRNPPHDYLGYEKEDNNTIVIKVTKNKEETFDKFRSIVSAADCEIRFEIVNNSAVNMEAYRDLFKKQIGYYDQNPYKIYAVGISDSGDGYIYVLREKYVMGEDTSDELAEYIENIMRTHRHFDDCEVRILEYESAPDSFDYLRSPENEVIFITESLALPVAKPQTSPATSDPAGMLCLVLSAVSTAGIAFVRRRK